MKAPYRNRASAGVPCVSSGIHEKLKLFHVPQKYVWDAKDGRGVWPALESWRKGKQIPYPTEMNTLEKFSGKAFSSTRELGNPTTRSKLTFWIGKFLADFRSEKCVQ